jgi:hypothetical protein
MALFEKSYQAADGIREIGHLHRVIRLIEDIDDGLVDVRISIVVVSTEPFLPIVLFSASWLPCKNIRPYSLHPKQ